MVVYKTLGVQAVGVGAVASWKTPLGTLLNLDRFSWRMA